MSEGILRVLFSKAKNGERVQTHETLASRLIDCAKEKNYRQEQQPVHQTRVKSQLMNIHEIIDPTKFTF